MMVRLSFLIGIAATIALALTAPCLAQTTQCVASANAGGTGDAITVPLLPCSVTTTLLLLKLTATNTITAPTVQMVGATAQVLVHADGSALTAAELASGTTMLLTNNGTNWIKLVQGFPVGNNALANMPAFSVKCNATASAALPTDCQTLTLSPPSGFTQAINTAQVPTGTVAAMTAVNQIFVGISSIDSATVTSGAAPFNSLQALRIAHTYGSSTLQGGRNSLRVESSFTGASASANVNRNYVGISNIVTATTGDGGASGACTGSGGVSLSGTCYKGAYFASNPYASALSGATLLFELTGGEVDIDAEAGSSVAYKAGWSIAQVATDAIRGTIYDCALCISNAVGAIGWTNGITFGPMNGQGPIQTNGALLSTTGSATIATGIDISSYTYTGFSLKTPGFTVAGAGNLITKIGTNADSTGQPGGVFASEVYNATNVSGQSGLFVKINWGTSTSKVLEVGNDIVSGAYVSYFSISGAGDIRLAPTTGNLATTAVGPFPYVPAMAGAPTGAPSAWAGGNIPVVIDVTNHKICWNETGAGGGWKCALGS